IQGVQMIEVNHVILNRLGGRNNVADQARVVGNCDAQCVLDRVDRSQCVDHGANATDPLRPNPSLPRISAAQDQLNPPEHRSRAPCICYQATVYLSLNAEVSLNTCHWIDHNPRHAALPTLRCYPATCL